MILQSDLVLCSGSASDFADGAALPDGYSLDANVPGYRICEISGLMFTLEDCAAACLGLAACNTLSYDENCCFLYESVTCSPSGHNDAGQYASYAKPGAAERTGASESSHSASAPDCLAGQCCWPDRSCRTAPEWADGMARLGRERGIGARKWGENVGTGVRTRGEHVGRESGARFRTRG